MWGKHDGNRPGHLASAFHWSADGRDGWPASLAAGIGTTFPILLAASLGQLQLGLVAALGALMAGSVRATPAATREHSDLASVLAVIVIAAAASVAIAGHGGWTDAALVLLAASTALIGGYSQPLAVATGRFIILLVLTLSIAEGGHSGASVAALLGAGALWTMLVTQSFERLFADAGAAPVAAAPASTATAAQKFRRWRRSIAHLSGWQFALRLTVCLLPAGILRWFWPGHHLIWIALTVVLLCRRPLEVSPVPVTQRMIGALLGVAATGLLAYGSLPALPLTVILAVLAGLAAWFRPRNYLAYTASMTPLIILLLDMGRPIEPAILVDRLVATAIGAGLVLAANHLMTMFLRATARASDRYACEVLRL